MHVYSEKAPISDPADGQRDEHVEPRPDLRLSSAISEISLDTTEQLDSNRGGSKSGKSCIRKACLVCLWMIVIFIAIDAILIPTCFYTCGWLRRAVVFKTFWSSGVPEPVKSYGFISGHDFFVEPDNKTCLKGWNLPVPSINFFGIHIKSRNDIVVLYLHGSEGHRGANHSIGLYRMLNAIHISVVTFDYRGYGDSVGTPSADSLVEDAQAVYHQLRERYPANRIVLWGQSIGAWVALKVLATMNQLGELPLGAVLEAPFDHVANVFAAQPYTLVLRLLPWFDKVYINSLKTDPATDMDSMRVVPEIGDVPVLVLHSKDDRVVPYELGVNLYKALVVSRLDDLLNLTHTESLGDGVENEFPVAESDLEPESFSALGLTFKTFNATFGYGHTGLYGAPELPSVVEEFLQRAKEAAQPPKSTVNTMIIPAS